MNLIKYCLLLIIYIIMGTVLWGKQEYMLPIFIALYIVVNLYFMDASKNYFRNFIESSGVVCVALLASLFTKDTDTALVSYYIGSMTVSSLTVYYLTRTKSLIPFHD